ncbi:MAG: glutathione peroxidase [Rhizobiaceae bacterium]
MRNLMPASLVLVVAATQLVFASEPSQTTAHSFKFEDAKGGTMNLSDFAGKVVLVVNTASECSFTKQYGPLQSLYEKYRDQGFVVVGVPSNDFGGQEPGSDEEISEFTSKEFQVGFPIASKTKIKGRDATPFYSWAEDQVGTLGKPRWNFHKYLIGPDGKMITWFSTMTQPGSKKLSNAIEKALSAIDPATGI